MGIFSRKPKETEQKKLTPKKRTRSFKGAVAGRFTQWMFETFTKINVDTKHDFKKLISRCRDLSKNNEIMRSHLNNFEKSIIGNKRIQITIFS